ncbi:hypothetical protein SAMN05216338_1001847 [Bradyrhizobium sp. Rc2d]|uniref:hypothetical protein n=1 Tax=Bradyrhizobium sp. Rc2d TaxID=1855321 RepID=UPI000890344E|nr:hypothetical protein [Bradyrhizobium sp. Rc2d]SDG59493.1 hypothetical protein SAMN05216338_1001847 [Bradyrhizobium sp. Rc2d]
MNDNQTLISILFGIAMVIAAVSVVRGWRASARLKSMREAVQMLSMICSHHYEEKGEELPKKNHRGAGPDETRSREKDIHSRCRQYVNGAGRLGDAMGRAPLGASTRARRICAATPCR